MADFLVFFLLLEYTIGNRFIFNNSSMIKAVERLSKRVSLLEESISEIKKETKDVKENRERLSQDISLVKEEILEQLDELKQDVDKNADDIKKLEELSKKVDIFSKELDSLKNEVLASEDDKEKKEWSPTLFARVFYGWLIVNTLGNMPVIGNSIKAWAEKKVENSGEEEAKSWNKKTGFFRKVWNTVFWSGIATAGVWFWKKLIPDTWMKEIKSWFPWTDEAAKKETPSSPEMGPDVESGDADITNTEIVDNENIETPVEEETSSSEDVEGVEQELSFVDDQESPEEEKTAQEVERMYSEGYSELYILMKMYQMGFVPQWLWKSRFIFGKILQGKPLEAAGKLSQEMRARIIQSLGKNRDIALQLKLNAIAHQTPDLIKDFDAKHSKISSLLQDFEKGTISSLEDVKQKYPDLLKEFGDKKYLSSQQKYLESIKVKSQHEFDRMHVIENELKQSDVDLKKISWEAQKKLQELNNQAKNADATTKKQLQQDAKKIVDDYNKRVLDIERKSGLQLAHMNATEIQKMSNIGVADWLLKINGKIDGFIKNNKTGKFMLGAWLFTLATDYAIGVKDGKQVALEVGDIWIWMVPFGGAYDVVSSITWKGIAWNLSTWDRVLRGVVWWASLILDVVWLFTFGAGTVASAGLKWAVKWWVAVAKAGRTVVKWAQWVMTWAKVLGLSYLWYTLVSSTAPVVYNLGKMGIDKIDKQLTPDITVE
jgi:archaellum component FlaC